MAAESVTDAADIAATVDAVFAAESARIVSAIVRVTGDWQLAEDSLQDAAVRALRAWPTEGVPRNPGAWLTTVAKNRAIDLLRRSAAERRAVLRIAHEPGAGDSAPAGDVAREEESMFDDRQVKDGRFDDGRVDDRLSLIFTCCHPALSMDARVALTLRTVAGMSVETIARSFVVSEPTMAKRLVRARAKIADAGIPYRVPPRELLHERMTGVLAVLYLLFNAGYSSARPEGLIDTALEAEAVRLTRLLVHLVDADGVVDAAGDRSESVALLALMLLNSSRDRARVDGEGMIVPLDVQDRSRWDHDAIAEAVSLLNGVTSELADRGEPAGRYYLQARIAAQHGVAGSADDTDFAQIARLYGQLAAVMPSPMVELNRAVAVAMADGPEPGLRLVEAIAASGSLDGYYLLPAARADLLQRLGRDEEARGFYARAAALAPTRAERAHLQAKTASLRR
ncbi:MAG: sigma-70 family RNA polymerase sigma factor [Acidobacteria bacterium]|nr:sigma-70 family RNA polymerase sigma factor [Acidobacteriota bacterium]